MSSSHKIVCKVRRRLTIRIREELCVMELLLLRYLREWKKDVHTRGLN